MIGMAKNGMLSRYHYNISIPRKKTGPHTAGLRRF
jgi:hypothetical protein